jgi:hypothetical protein
LPSAVFIHPTGSRDTTAPAFAFAILERLICSVRFLFSYSAKLAAIWLITVSLASRGSITRLSINKRTGGQGEELLECELLAVQPTNINSKNSADCVSGNLLKHSLPPSASRYRASAYTEVIVNDFDQFLRPPISTRQVELTSLKSLTTRIFLHLFRTALPEVDKGFSR